MRVHCAPPGVRKPTPAVFSWKKNLSTGAATDTKLLYLRGKQFDVFFCNNFEIRRKFFETHPILCRHVRYPIFSRNSATCLRVPQNHIYQWKCKRQAVYTYDYQLSALQNESKTSNFIKLLLFSENYKSFAHETGPAVPEEDTASVK